MSEVCIRETGRHGFGCAEVCPSRKRWRKPAQPNPWHPTKGDTADGIFRSRGHREQQGVDGELHQAFVVSSPGYLLLFVTRSSSSWQRL